MDEIAENEKKRKLEKDKKIKEDMKKIEEKRKLMENAEKEKRNNYNKKILEQEQY